MSQVELLEVHNVTKRFPGVLALDGVSLRVRPGTVHALLGENGAGKSTLMKILIGLYERDEGEIRLKGKSVNFVRPGQALAAGVSMIQQELSPIPDMTVAENIFLGREPTRLGFLVDYTELNRRAKEVLDRLGLTLEPKRQMKTLSTAEVQLVEVAKALSHDADVIIMDEPTSAISDKEVETLLSLVRVLKEGGKGILYISHKFEEIFRIADDATVFRDGKHVATVRVSETTQGELVQMMTGKETGGFPKANAPTNEVLLDVKNFSRKDEFEDVSFSLHKGEILGVFGLMGAGKSELLHALFGVTKADSGTLHLNGRRIKMSTPFDAHRRGLALVTEDRKESGLMLPMSVRDNVALASLPKLNRAGVLSSGTVKREVNEVTTSLDVRMASPAQPVQYLSGGNQQKVILAKWLLTKPQILLLDEPTRGIDVGAKEEIYRFMSSFVEGRGVILVSSELPEILGMSDRILVLRGGRVAGELGREEASKEALMRLAG